MNNEMDALARLDRAIFFFSGKSWRGRWKVVTPSGNEEGFNDRNILRIIVIIIIFMIVEVFSIDVIIIIVGIMFSSGCIVKIIIFVVDLDHIIIKKRKIIWYVGVTRSKTNTVLIGYIYQKYIPLLIYI